MTKNKLGLVLVLTTIFWAALISTAYGEVELTGGQYFTLVDEKGTAIDYTGQQVSVGDEYISADNTYYRVERITGLTAHARTLGKVDLTQATAFSKWDYFIAYEQLAAANKPVVGIYSTHNDESYTPTDGQDSIRGKGGIIKVADSLTQGLYDQGLNAVHSKATHDPHDANAYNRSRKTASNLLRKGALALIDVHRDSAPAKAYATEVEGKDVTKIKLVVGRSNPKMAANLDFAKRVKAYIDKELPGLSAGIFMGKGNYNQDLSSRAMLIEVGGEKNDRKAAEEAVSMFAGVIPEVLGAKTSTTGGTPDSGSNAGQGGQKSNFGVTFGIIAVVAILAGAFFMLNKGKVK